MKQERGITITSLVIYIIGLIVVIGMVGSFSGYFFKNTDEISAQNSSKEEYTSFLAFFTKDTNSEELNSVEIIGTSTTSGNHLKFTFLNGESHEYTIENEKLSYIEKTGDTLTKNIILCTNVTINGNAFKYDGTKILVNFNINEQEFSNTFYV